MALTRTRLIQLVSHSLYDAPQLFDQKHRAGTPVVIVVKPHCSIICKLNVPSGTTTLGQKWGAHEGVYPPGYICCYCGHRRIVAVITRNTIRYDTPIKDCPTKDNVRVHVHITFNFRIGPNEKDCEKFIYTLGAAKLDELLIAESEEAIRNFVHSVKLSQVLDMKSEIAGTMLEDLNAKFNGFGVFFESASVIEIDIPKGLAEALSHTTKYDILLQNQQKKQENSMLIIENEGIKTMTDLQRENNKKLEALKASRDRAYIERQEHQINGQAAYDVAITTALQGSSVLKTKVEGEKNIVENQAQRQVMELLNSTRAESTSRIIQADNKLNIAVLQSQAQLYATKCIYDAILQEGQAEGKNAENLKAKRNYELDMAEVEVLEDLARKGKMIIAGKAGNELLKAATVGFRNKP